MGREFSTITITALNGKIYAVGDNSQSIATSTGLFEFDPMRNQWKFIDYYMRCAISPPEEVFMIPNNDKLVIFSKRFFGRIHSLAIYDLNKNIWELEDVIEPFYAIGFLPF